MKRNEIFLLLFIFINGNAISQSTIYKIWVSPNHQILNISKKKTVFSESWNYSTSCNDSLLTLTHHYWKAGKFFRQQENLTFKITKLTNDSLILKPLNESAQRLFFGRPLHNDASMIFLDKSLFYNSTISLQKIYYHTSFPLSFRSMKIEIDSFGNVFYLDINHLDDTSMLYKGQLSKVQFNQLVELLYTSDIEHLTISEFMSIDTGYKEIKIHYNSKIKHQKGYQIADFYSPLFRYLNSICKKIPLERTFEDYEFGQ